jgi:Domain of unknown function (DUF222)
MTDGSPDPQPGSDDDGQSGPAGPGGPDPAGHGQPGASGSRGAGSWPAAGVQSGFACGGRLDTCAAGPRLAAAAEQAWQAGLDELPDDELIGLMRAARRLASRAAALELSTVANLAARRQGPGHAGDAPAGEQVDAEVAAALTLTPCAAAHLQDVALGTARLPAVLAALKTGRIDQRKAEVILSETSALGDIEAAAVAAVVIRDAEWQTTGQLRAATRLLVCYLDPAAVRRRKETALKQARVESWPEPAGTCALAGRDLPAAYAIAADKHVAAAAAWLKAHGLAGSTGQLRAAAFLTLLTGQPLESLLPGHPAYHRSAASQLGLASRGPAGAAPGPAPAGPATNPATHPGSAPSTSPPSNRSGNPPGNPASGPAGPALTGSVNLTMPLATWLGQAHAPGVVPGFGPLDATDSRALAAMLSRHPATRWCLTLTDAAGHPLAHGCSRASPGPPVSGLGRQPGAPPPAAGPPAGWLAGLRPAPLHAHPCDHSAGVAGYHPPPRMRHLAHIRNPACVHPGCRRPASQCDLDHALPYHLGGPTCLCNVYPRCRRHHRCKQAPGWRLSRSASGGLTLTTPAGRSYPTRPPAYPV